MQLTWLPALDKGHVPLYASCASSPSASATSRRRRRAPSSSMPCSSIHLPMGGLSPVSRRTRIDARHFFAASLPACTSNSFGVSNTGGLLSLHSSHTHTRRTFCAPARRATHHKIKRQYSLCSHVYRSCNSFPLTMREAVSPELHADFQRFARSP